MADIFFDIGTVIIIATVFAYVAKVFKQPMIPAYILTGLIIGPFLELITNTSVITTLSEIGIAFLLFIVGLEIDIRRLRDVGIVASIGSLVQMLLIFTLALVVSILLGFIIIEGIYLGLIVAFSSTMIVIKLLSDKREIDTLHGRIIIGILLMQDIIAIFALSVLTTIGNFSFSTIIFSIVKGFIVFLIAFFAGKYLFPKIFTYAAKSQELLFISAISASFLFSLLFSYIGFSIAIGAFVAGVILANLPYNIEIIGKIKPLRDFFSVLFFVSLGMELMLSSFRHIILPLIIFILIVVLFKPLTIMFTCSFFGYKKRTAFLSSISLGQISEFSLIIAAQGLLLGHVSNEIFSITVLLATITIGLAPYFINFQDGIYNKLKGYLRAFDHFPEKNRELEYIPKKTKSEVILCGYNRIGFSIVRTLKKLKKNILIVDFNPEIIKKLIDEKIPCIYGDVGDIEILERINLKNAKLVISTVPTERDNLLLIRKAKNANKDIAIFVTASQIPEALELYDAGADYVILPHFLGGEHVSLLIEKISSNINKIIEHKLRHIRELEERHALGHKHPEHR